jgi:hypothetical protein
LEFSSKFYSLDDFLTGFLENHFLPLDPNNLLCMAWKGLYRNALANNIAEITELDGKLQ